MTHQGNFHIQFTHDNMDYKNSLINATHLIDHLTFGDRLPLSVANMLDQIDASGPGFNTLANHDFVSLHADRTYEHFIQVRPTAAPNGTCSRIIRDASAFVQIVPTIYKTRKTGEVTVYRYTVMSAEHEDTERYPSAKFTFQVSLAFAQQRGKFRKA